MNSAKNIFPFNLLLTGNGYVPSLALTGTTHNFSWLPLFVTDHKQTVNGVLSWTLRTAGQPGGSCRPGFSQVPHILRGTSPQHELYYRQQRRYPRI